MAGYKNLLIPDRSYLDLTNINDTRSFLIDNKLVNKIINC